MARFKNDDPPLADISAIYNDLVDVLNEYIDALLVVHSQDPSENNSELLRTAQVAQTQLVR